MCPVFGDKTSMMTVVLVSGWVKGLVIRERLRTGADREAARRRLAQRLSVSPGTLERLERQRVKKVDGDLREAIRQLWVRELETELCAKTHEIHVLKQMGRRPDAPDFGAVEQALAGVRALLREITT